MNFCLCYYYRKNLHFLMQGDVIGHVQYKEGISMNSYKKIALCAVLTLMVAPFSFAVAAESANQAESEYQQAKEKSHANVGIDQRRDAYREYLAKRDAENAPLADIEPAAGDQVTEATQNKAAAQTNAPQGASKSN